MTVILIGLVLVVGLLSLRYFQWRRSQTPFRVWVKVVDQQNRPVRDCAIGIYMQYVPFYPSVFPKSWGHVYVTDRKGMVFFDTGRHRGYVVHVTRGPENDPRNMNIQFPMSGVPYNRLDTPASSNPVTIVARDNPLILDVERRGRPVPLIKSEVEATVEPCAGQKLSINILSGSTRLRNRGRESLGISFQCGKHSRASGAYSSSSAFWRIASMTVVAPEGGGVQAVKDSYRIWAPEQGYKGSYTFPGSDLNEKNSCELYFKLLNGRVFGHLFLNVSPGGQGRHGNDEGESVFVVVHYSANPAASRNLFSTYGQKINLPITLQDLDKYSSPRIFATR